MSLSPAIETFKSSQVSNFGQNCQNDQNRESGQDFFRAIRIIDDSTAKGD